MMQHHQNTSRNTSKYSNITI